MLSVSFLSPKTYKDYKKKVNSDCYPSRRAAFRAAKRDAKIPMSQNPDKVIRPRSLEGDLYALDDRNVRLYIFNLGIGVVAYEHHIREDEPATYGNEDGAGDQLPHFNSGEPPNKLKEHFFWIVRKIFKNNGK